MRSLFTIVGICLMAGLPVWTMFCVLRAFMVGIRASYSQGSTYRPYVITRRFLALNLCEPVVNCW